MENWIGWMCCIMYGCQFIDFQVEFSKLGRKMMCYIWIGFEMFLVGVYCVYEDVEYWFVWFQLEVVIVDIFLCYKNFIGLQ